MMWDYFVFTASILSLAYFATAFVRLMKWNPE
jgi:hypothetical protein